MKHHHPPITNGNAYILAKNPHRSIAFLSGLSITLFFISLPNLAAQVEAHFTGGGSQSAPVNDIVDAYRGMLGGGWTSRWTVRNNYGSGSLGDVVVRNARGIWQGSSLQLIPSNNEGGEGFGVYRTYSDHVGLDVSGPMKISFSMSIDDMGEFLSSPTNTIFVGENATSSMNPTSASSWAIIGSGGSDSDAFATKYLGAKQAQWNIGNGANYVPTGILLQENVLYQFDLTIFPSSYTYQLRLTAGEQIFESGPLAFLAEVQMGRSLNIGSLYMPEQGATYSFGALTIGTIPEPSSIAFGSIGALLLLKMSLRGKQRKTESH